MKKKTSQKKLNGDTPATQHDLALWGGELALRIDEKPSKKDVKNIVQGELQKELQQYATKQDLKESEGRIIAEIQALRESDKADLDAAHHDELDIVTEKKAAPSTWKSIPRRLKTVEMDVEKIKDKLA